MRRALAALAHAPQALVLGCGREGESTYRFLRARFPRLRIDLADQAEITLPRTDATRVYTGAQYLTALEHYAVILKAPGISPHIPEVAAARARGALVTSHTQLFFEACPSPKTLGVTGTKGKSTTASLIHHVLQSLHLPSVLVGNIGRPALDYLDQITADTWVVCELSSFQLMDLTVSPHLAVLLPFYADHLDYHKDLAEYHHAKLAITRHQQAHDHLICHHTHQGVATRAQVHVFSGERVPPEVVTPLVGAHNKVNIAPSLILGDILHLPQDALYAALASFQPLETRLEHCGTYNAITFYADTLATIPEAAIAAIDALHPATLIAGGHERNQNYHELAEKIVHSAITTLVLFKETGARIHQEVLRVLHHGALQRPIRFYHAESMQEAVARAYAHTPPGSVCLLSPAAPSFTLFKDYRDEAAQYKHYIRSTQSLSQSGQLAGHPDNA